MDKLRYLSSSNYDFPTFAINERSDSFCVVIMDKKTNDVNQSDWVSFSVSRLSIALWLDSRSLFVHAVALCSTNGNTATRRVTKSTNSRHPGIPWQTRTWSRHFMYPALVYRRTRITLRLGVGVSIGFGVRRRCFQATILRCPIISLTMSHQSQYCIRISHGILELINMWCALLIN